MSSIDCVCGYNLRDEHAGRILSREDYDKIFTQLEDYIENKMEPRGDKKRTMVNTVAGITGLHFSAEVWQCPNCLRLICLTEDNSLFFKLENPEGNSKIL